MILTLRAGLARTMNTEMASTVTRAGSSGKLPTGGWIWSLDNRRMYLQIYEMSFVYTLKGHKLNLSGPKMGGRLGDSAADLIASEAGALTSKNGGEQE